MSSVVVLFCAGCLKCLVFRVAGDYGRQNGLTGERKETRERPSWAICPWASERTISSLVNIPLMGKSGLKLGALA